MRTSKPKKFTKAFPVSLTAAVSPHPALSWLKFSNPRKL